MRMIFLHLSVATSGTHRRFFFLLLLLFWAQQLALLVVAEHMDAHSAQRSFHIACWDHHLRERRQLTLISDWWWFQWPILLDLHRNLQEIQGLIELLFLCSPGSLSGLFFWVSYSATSVYYWTLSNSKTGHWDHTSHHQMQAYLESPQSFWSYRVQRLILWFLLGVQRRALSADFRLFRLKTSEPRAAARHE